uniref:Pancreatic trypsin inhibitor n=1 Tax=Rhipicephalus appendiculatus TaxID=34631 RepID=A0A131YHQ2_RHIAP
MRTPWLQFFAYCNVVYFVPVHGRGSGCLSMPTEGDCDTETDHWYYNSEESKCVNFMYGDCAQDGNNFVSAQECESACKGAGKGRPPQKGGKGRGSEENETVGGKGQGGGKWRPGPGGWPKKPKKPNRRPWPPKKRPRPSGPEEENETGWKGHGGGGRQRPKPWPKPPSKGPGRGSCAARTTRSKKGCGNSEGMWFYNGAFMTCTTVKYRACPTVGSFFASCEDCMSACQPRKLKQCQHLN